jgi:hypothetical protein
MTLGRPRELIQWICASIADPGLREFGSSAYDTPFNVAGCLDHVGRRLAAEPDAGERGPGASVEPSHLSQIALP